jgi:hypothetical protein
VGDGIAGETAKKLTHEKIGILKRYGLDKKVYLTIKNMRHIGHSDLKRVI